MRAQLHQVSGEILPQNDDFQIDETVLDVHMKQAIARMLDWCARSPNVATFMARGFVVDTLSDISTQITDYFPRSINVMPIIDDLSFVVAQSARRTGQRYQEVALDYISDGKIPEAAQANKQSFVKWYSVENVIGGDFDGHAKKLRPGWSGGAGSPTDMLKHLNLGTKKGFLLQVNALDIKDAKAQSLAADTSMMQAMGGSAAAMKEAGDAVAAGGVEAAKAQAVIEALVEIKTIKAALTQAADTPQAAPLAAALALKTDVLATTIGQVKLPAAMQAETARIVETVRVDMSAKQITTALQTIVSNMPAIVTARPANDGAGPAGFASQLVKSITALQIASQTANMPMREVVALALTKQAPPALADAVKAVTTQLARKEALPVLDRLLPPAAAVTVRSMLTTPALKTVSQTPVSVAPVVAQIKALAAQMANPAQTQTQASVQAGATKAAATPVTDATALKSATPIASAPAPAGIPASVVATTDPASNATPAASVPKVTEISSVAVAPVSAAPVLSVVSSAKGAFAQPAAPLAAQSPAPSLPVAAVGIAAPAATIAPSTTAGATTAGPTPASATTQVQAPAPSAPATVAVKAPTTVAPAASTPTISVAATHNAGSAPVVAAAAPVSAAPVLSVVSSAKGAFAQPSAPIAAPSPAPSLPAAAVGIVALTATVAPATAAVATPAVAVAATHNAGSTPVVAAAVTTASAAPAAVTPAVIIPAAAPLNVPPVAVVAPVSAPQTTPALQPFASQATAVVTAPVVNPVSAPAMQSYEAPVAVAAPPPVQSAQATPLQAPQAPVQQAEMQRVEAPAPANTNIAPSTPLEGAQQAPKLRVVIDPVEAQPIVEPSAPKSMAEETLKMAAVVLNDSKNATPQSGAEMAQAVADNLQAVANKSNVADATRSELTVLAAEAQVVGQQAKNGQYVPDIPQQPTLLNQQAPLAEMTRAVDVKTPTGVTEPTEAVARHMDMLRNDANTARQNMEMLANNDKVSPFSIKTTPKATEAEKAKEEVKRGCGDCKNGFNCATCGTQTPAEKKQTDATLSAAEKALQARNAELGHNRPAMS